MRKSGWFAAVLLAIAAAATAADKTPVFTRSGMEEAALPWRYVDSPIHPIDGRRVRWHVGWVELKTPIGPFRLIYLPLMAPLNGSFGSRNWQGTPNAFDLTNMQIPQRPPKEEEPKTSIEIKKEE
ncbi:MAG TPA: hypothetical protein VJZ76_03940 [Thermoanaerobaculia bacterium]|nr:hypothetical protein [Thermoanaerobaculia bacterium]